MLIRPAIGDTDPIRYRRPTPDGQFSGNIIDEAMRPAPGSKATPIHIYRLGCLGTISTLEASNYDPPPSGRKILWACQTSPHQQ